MAKIPAPLKLPKTPTKRVLHARAPHREDLRPNTANKSKQSKGIRQYDPDLHCGSNLRKKPGRYCTQPKGARTPHLGEGRCWLHGGLTPIKHGLNSLIKHGRLKDMLRKMAHIDHDILDLTPEIELLRALTLDYVNRYDTFIDQLETWYDALDLSRRNLDVPLPPVPRKFPSIEDAGPLLEAISRMIERVHKITREGSITLDVFRGLMTQMGMTVAKHVTDSGQLQAIENDWSAIMVNPRSFVKESGKGTYAADPEEEDEET